MQQHRRLSRRLGAVVLAAYAVLLGCDPRQDPDRKRECQAECQQLEAQQTGASPVNAMAAAGIVGQMLENAKDPGPFGEPTRSSALSALGAHHALLELRGAVTELEPTFSLLPAAESTPLRSLTDRLHGLGSDSRVKGILLRVEALEVSAAVAEELRAVLVQVAKSKPVHCYVDQAEGRTYFVLTGCTSIGLAGGGSLSIPGPVATPLYLKGLLDKLSVQADFIHVGAFKGAAEPLTRTGPSPEMRLTLQTIVDGEYDRLLAALLSGRKLGVAQASAAVDRALFTDAEAKAAGLVDEIVGFEAWRSAHVEGGEWLRVDLDEEEPDLERVWVFLGVQPRKRLADPHLALLYAVGDVVDGRGDGRLAARGEIAPRYLAAALHAAADDQTVKAIVIRIDSPGGSALASESIADAVSAARAKKPVYVSMGSLAASGGYYIAAGASRIFAQPDTLTGSIGVVGGKLVVGPALAKLGINLVEIGRGARAGIWLPTRPWTPDERQAVEASMLAVYERFKARVADGRKKAVNEVERLAQGRVWTGADALGQGLVDELGGLDETLAAARHEAGLATDAPIDVYPGEPTLLDLLQEVVGDFGATGVSVLDPAAASLAQIRLALGPRAAASIARNLRMLVRFRAEPVQVVMFPPLGF